VRSSVKPSHPANDNLKDDLTRRTRQVWQPRLGRDLNNEDARQIAANVSGFFSVLAEWSRAEMQSPANDAGKPDASENKEARHDR
jgi:chemotaxis regulatin CheY-phosphate phosphatase CheZ